MGREELILSLGLAGIVGLSVSYVATNDKRQEVKKIREQTKLPSEYWLAKAEEAKASIEKTRLDNEMKERLTLDQRTRDDAERAKRREFEQRAPKEYWEHKKIEAEERTKREKIEAEEKTKRENEELRTRAMRENERLRAEADRYIARQNSDAITNGARIISTSLRQTSE